MPKLIASCLALATLGAAFHCAAQERVLRINVTTSGNLIDRALVHEIARRNRIEPAAPELAAMRKKWNAAAPGNSTGSASQSGSRKKLDEEWVQALVVGFKVNRYLWNKHGGRLVLSAFGFHLATDGFAAEARILEQSGVVRFENAADRETFFRRIDTYTGDGVTRGERAREILSKPPWE